MFLVIMQPQVDKIQSKVGFKTLFIASLFLVRIEYAKYWNENSRIQAKKRTVAGNAGRQTGCFKVICFKMGNWSDTPGSR